MEKYVLRTVGLTKQFSGIVAVNDVTTQIHEGILKGIIGPNGAGKTTFFNLISGALLPTNGQIFFNGEEITRCPPHVRSHRGIARSYQITNIFLHLTVFENVRIAVQSRAKWDTNYNLFSKVEKYESFMQKTLELLEMVKLADKAYVIALNLPHADQRKLEIAMTLATEPSLLLLDEPTAGMAIEEIPEMLEVIIRLKKREELTILLIEHKLDMVMDMVDSVMVMAEGEVIADDKPEMIKKNEFVQKAYLGS